MGAPKCSRLAWNEVTLPGCGTLFALGTANSECAEEPLPRTRSTFSCWNAVRLRSTPVPGRLALEARRSEVPGLVIGSVTVALVMMLFVLLAFVVAAPAQDELAGQTAATQAPPRCLEALPSDG